MTAAQLWERFRQTGAADAASGYEAWQFGDDADRLLKLVLFGEKTATSSAFAAYEHDNESLPCAGEYSVILDSTGAAKCIIRTTAVYILPFSRVSQVHACKEGEGDKSLESWRRTHQRFFTQELAAIGLEFTEDLSLIHI